MEKNILDFEISFIQEARDYLENPNFLIKMSQLLENPIERGLTALPQKVQTSIHQATHQALKVALRTALLSLGSSKSTTQPKPTQDLQSSLQNLHVGHIRHDVATTVTGVASGLFGMPALMIELPLTTTLMLRSIANTASHLGADLNDRETQLDCLFVLSAGSDYLSTRVAFSGILKEALLWLAGQGTKQLSDLLLQGATPVLIRLISQIAGRFEWVVAEKLIAQSVPIVGAVSGGVINLAFTEHFNRVALYHFGLKKLEQIYGKEQIQDLYRQPKQKT